jgi:hypothetical protein
LLKALNSDSVLLHLINLSFFTNYRKDKPVFISWITLDCLHKYKNGRLTFSLGFNKKIASDSHEHGETAKYCKSQDFSFHRKIFAKSKALHQMIF